MAKKSIKRILSVALVAVMVLAMMCVGFTANAATLKYNIDYTKKASLTLFKYEMPDIGQAVEGSIGKMTDQTKVPESAKPLAGVTFSVYKVSDLSAYFKPDSAVLPSADEAQAIVGEKAATYTGVTNKDGKVEFKNMDLGIYLIKETDGPAQVTKKIDPFVLSLPTTNEDGSEWFYDVYSFPKNQTAYGDITVLKVDSKTEEPLPGAEFTLYQSEKIDGEYAEYKTGLKTGEDGKFEVLSLPVNYYYAFAETKTSDPSYILDSTVRYYFFVDATGDMINVTKDGDNWQVGEAVEDNTLVVGNDTVNIEKYILDGPKGAEGIDNTADYNEDVYWEIKTDVPANADKMTTYTVVDTMSKGLRFTGAEVFLDDKELTVNKDFKVSQVDLTVTFEFVPASLVNGKLVTIYFNTVLTEEAPLAVDIPNTSKLIYTNDIDKKTEFEKTSQKPTVHTGGYEFIKVKGENEEPLANAQFAIYASEQDAKDGKNAIRTVTSGDDGIVSFKGIKYGSFSTDAEGKAANGVDGGSTEYWIAEIQAPSGYSLLAAPFKVVINKDSYKAANTSPVKNYEIPTYPKTGGAGLIPVVAVAVTLVGAGLVLLTITRKRRKK